MVKVKADEYGNNLTISQKLGFPWGFGRIWFGVSRYGDSLELSGIYQRRSTKAGQIFVRENFYWPINTLSVELENNRLIFAQGVATWKDMNDEEKEYYRALRQPENMSGYNRFMRLWLRALLG